MAKRIRLTRREIESLLGAAGNIDPCMFDENPEASEREKERDRDAWESGIRKLEAMLDKRGK
jgi:gamma-glutamyl-gamma-aminobutyrate hydrolase PuuD